MQDLGEPECYYFEEYEAPRMNPSVVAAHKRIGLLQRFNKWQGKAMEKMQKSMDKMVSKIKLGEESFWASSFEPREGEDNSREGGRAPRSGSNSTTGLDRVQTEETQLDRAGVELTWRSPCLRTPGSSTIQRSTRTSLRLFGLPTTALSKRSSSKAKEATHISTMKKRRKRSHKLDRVSRTQSSGAFLMAVYHLQTTT
ncbi:unnamed protein product [Microthlaspi erraticum]|uniref:Arabidopsis retrotransposon Orf1 C-terminal domain-containing protein n=1 Tax=Microthlaspi erraticum TaxID=1685480 RepID=A0A6D2K0A0_9BRAS|nr:unnamed protein product [Microthlaspi erraticum]